MAPALILALTLMASSSTPAPDGPGEPLPSGAPSEPYQLTGWCYGALAEYLEIYDVVKPDLVAIDKMFGTPVKEAEPYQSDVAAYRDELKIFASAIEATERASPQVISSQGAVAIRAGQAIWRPAEARTRRELARAWLSWGMPDQCDTNARALLAKSTVLGKALSYNNRATNHSAAPAAGPANANADSGALTLAPIAPIVTQDAAATKGSTLANAGQPPASSLPPASAPAAAPAPAPPGDQPPPAGDVVAAAPPHRVLGEAPTSSEPATDNAPAPEAQAPVAAAPEPGPAAAPTSAPPAVIKQPSDQAQEPVL